MFLHAKIFYLSQAGVMFSTLDFFGRGFSGNYIRDLKCDLAQPLSQGSQVTQIKTGMSYHDEAWADLA